jgi:hypothetical protein
MLVPLGNNGGAVAPAVEAGIALLDRLQRLDDVLRPTGRGAAGFHRILDRRQFDGQWQNLLAQRGWTLELIDEAIATGRRYPAPNYVNRGNTATRYVSPRTGQSAGVDDQTGEVLHVGAPGYRY